MSLGPVSYLSTPLEDFPNYFLKFYEQGTNDPLEMATDVTGDTLLAKAEISGGGVVPVGFIKTVGNAIFIPFVDGAYDAFLFPTAQEADDNNTTNAVQIANDITATPPTGSGATAVQEDTTATMTANTNKNYVVGDVVQTAEFSTGNGGGGTYNVVLTSGVTPNTSDIIIGVADDSISFVLRIGDFISAAELGITGSGDESIAFQRGLDLSASLLKQIQFYTLVSVQGITLPEFCDLKTIGDGLIKSVDGSAQKTITGTKGNIKLDIDVETTVNFEFLFIDDQSTLLPGIDFDIRLNNTVPAVTRDADAINLKCGMESPVISIYGTTDEDVTAKLLRVESGPTDNVNNIHIKNIESYGWGKPYDGSQSGFMTGVSRVDNVHCERMNGGPASDPSDFVGLTFYHMRDLRIGRIFVKDHSAYVYIWAPTEMGLFHSVDYTGSLYPCLFESNINPLGTYISENSAAEGLHSRFGGTFGMSQITIKNPDETGMVVEADDGGTTLNECIIDNYLFKDCGLGAIIVRRGNGTARDIMIGNGVCKGSNRLSSAPEILMDGFGSSERIVIDGYNTDGSADSCVKDANGKASYAQFIVRNSTLRSSGTDTVLISQGGGLRLIMNNYVDDVTKLSIPGTPGSSKIGQNYDDATNAFI